MDRRNHPVKEKKYEKQEINGNYRVTLYVSTLQELHERLADLDLDQTFPPAARGPRGRAGGEKTPHLPDGWLDHPYLTQSERDRLHLAEIGY